MQVLNGPVNKVLEVDLSSRNFGVVQISPENRRMYLGGKGLGIKLLSDRMKPGDSPLGPENIIAFMPGVLAGTGAPYSEGFETVTRSPLTGLMTDSSFEGSFGTKLKTAGWDGLLIKGVAEDPVSIEITHQGVEFADASNLWGMDTASASKMLEGEGRGVLAIGPAGENKVRFAGIVSEGMVFGRAGMGAVMGAKKLKAVVVSGGTHKVRPFNRELFGKAEKRAQKYIRRNKVAISHEKFGSLCRIEPANRANILPVNNFTRGCNDYAFRISGENIRKKHDVISQGDGGAWGHTGIFNGEASPVPGYEAMVMLGSNIGIFDSERIAHWNRICVLAGMDQVSAGGTLAWVMEASIRGLVDELDLRFGSPDGVSEALDSISQCFGFGAEMAMGTRALSEKYGGRDFALQVKGLEIPAYDPRGSLGQGLSYAVSNSGGGNVSDFLAGLYSGFTENGSVRARLEFVKFMEDLTCCVKSVLTGHISIYPYLMETLSSRYTPESIKRFLLQNLPKTAISFIDLSLYRDFWSAATGEEITKREFLRAGERINVLQRYMNIREGVSRKDDTLPRRMLREWRETDPDKLKVPLDDMLDAYYKLRSYDENGIPTDRKLKKLGILTDLSPSINCSRGVEGEDQAPGNSGADDEASAGT